MRTKPNITIGSHQAATSSVIQALLGDLTGDELERVAVAVIRENRSRLQEAQELFEEIGRLEVTDPANEPLEQLRHDYRVSMLNLHAHHQLVSMVVELLGFVPQIDGQRPNLN